MAAMQGYLFFPCYTAGIFIFKIILNAAECVLARDSEPIKLDLLYTQSLDNSNGAL